MWLAMSVFMVVLGSGRTHGVSFRPFLNSSGWWRLISSIFLIRISCHRTTHANGYYGAWPGWVVSISVLPVTAPPCKMGYSGAIGSGSLGFFGFFPTCHQHLSGRKSLLRQKRLYPRRGAQYDIFPYYDIENLVRVSDSRSEDDILDSVYSLQVKGAF